MLVKFIVTVSKHVKESKTKLTCDKRCNMLPPLGAIMTFESDEIDLNFDAAVQDIEISWNKDTTYVDEYTIYLKHIYHDNAHLVIEYLINNHGFSHVW